MIQSQSNKIVQDKKFEKKKEKKQESQNENLEKRNNNWII